MMKKMFLMETLDVHYAIEREDNQGYMYYSIDEYK